MQNLEIIMINNDLTKPKMCKDKQLAKVNATDARRRWQENLPVTLKQMALSLEVGYDQVRGWSREDEFPFDGLVFRQSFERWWAGRFRQVRKVHQRNSEHPQPLVADIPGELVPMNGSSAALPPKAERLAVLAGLRR